MTWHTALIWLTGSLAGAALAYQLAAYVALFRYFTPQPKAKPGPRGVSLLKPLYGAEPRLTSNLATFLAQDRAGPLEMVCGTGSADDAAIPAVMALKNQHPNAQILLVAKERAAGANGKIGNLINMLPAATQDVLILSDSDMVVGPDYLARILAALEEPGVGAVSCLYVGRGDAGLWSDIGAAAISWQMMPNMVMGLTTGMAQPCMGSTIALTRQTLEAIGGFAPFANVLADDHAIGAAITAFGKKIAIPPILLTHAGAEASLRALWRHHLRWAVTIRALAGAGHYGSIITHALPLALIAMVFQPTTGLVLTATALTLRLALALKVNRLSPAQDTPLWLLPLADIFAFAVFCASLVARQIDWRGTSLTIAANGRIHARTGTQSEST